jgi:hypothetical protein
MVGIPKITPLFSRGVDGSLPSRGHIENCLDEKNEFQYGIGHHDDGSGCPSGYINF